MVTKTTLNSVELKFRSESAYPFGKLSLLFHIKRYDTLRVLSVSPCRGLRPRRRLFFLPFGQHKSLFYVIFIVFFANFCTQ